jgi:hypothetical protein
MRLFYIAVSGMTAISLASAGQIEIGAGQNGSGVSSQGLTVAYVDSIAQAATPWVGEKPYSTTLFSAAVISNSSLNGVSETTGVGAGGLSTLPTSQNGFQQFTDPNNGVTFAMMADSTTGDTLNNELASASAAMTGPSTITVPIDVSGAAQANILLNDYWGVAGSTTQTDTVEFFFSGGSDTFTLTNGVQIDAALQCLTGTTTICSTFAQTTSSPNTDSAWTGTYALGNMVNVYANTAGNAALSDLTFDLSAFAGDVLEDVTITDNNNGNNSSKLALSAITVSGSAATLSETPEPSTVVLFLTSLGILGFFGYRRKVRL